MSETRVTSKKVVGKASAEMPLVAYAVAGSYWGSTTVIGAVQSFQDESYLRGKIDGAKDMEIEMIKMGRALYQQAIDKATDITNELIGVSEKNKIVVFDFFLKIEDWDKIYSLIIVKLEDYIDDKIFNFYDAANKLSSKYNTETFHWDYLVTYYSDKISKDKILSDGYTLHYEHTPQPRKAQQEGV